MVPPSVVTMTAANAVHAGALLPLLLIICFTNDPLFVAATSKENWYTKYPKYPPYCSTPEQMRLRAIPELGRHPKIGDSRLLHVTAVIRHGSRTPASEHIDCWDGYRETMKWDCDLKTKMSLPTPREIQHGEQVTPHDGEATQAMFLFEKDYDALIDPENDIKNFFNGTCQKGQLLLQGFEQELTNGMHLRNAYAFDGKQQNHNEKMRLLDVNSDIYTPWEDPYLYFRSDDETRTLASGQALLRGMFGIDVASHWSEGSYYPTISLHTADMPQDIMRPNEDVCPRLKELREGAEKSREFRAFNASNEAKILRTFMQKELGRTMTSESDCLMTAICTDRDLPPAVDDYHLEDDAATGRYGTGMFQRLIDFHAARYAFHVLYNDAAFAKLAMAPLWKEIMEKINPVIFEDTYYAGSREPVMNKLAIFSAHDSTIMNLLASLGPRVWANNEWPAYATTFLIEIHELIDGLTDRTIYNSKYAFRLVYNGEVITSRVDGCPADAELCDVEFLLNQVNSFASTPRDCSPLHSSGEPSAFDDSIEVLTSFGGLMTLLIVSVLSAILGGYGMYAFLTGRLPFFKAGSDEFVELSARVALKDPVRYSDDDGNDASSAEMHPTY